MTATIGSNEVARILGVSPASIPKMVATGRIPRPFPRVRAGLPFQWDEWTISEFAKTYTPRPTSNPKATDRPRTPESREDQAFTRAADARAWLSALNRCVSAKNLAPGHFWA